MRLATALVIVALALSPTARAQSIEDDQMIPYGMEVSAGAGVVDFSSDAAQHLTTIGQMWSVSVLAWGQKVVAFEAQYTGTHNNFNQVMAPFAPNTAVIGSSLDGNFRLQVPRAISEAKLLGLQPYAFLGAGWNNYWLTNQPISERAVERADNMFMATWGAGSQIYATPHFVLDGRFTFREMINDNLLHTSSTGMPTVNSQEMNQWAFSARVGYAF